MKGQSYVVEYIIMFGIAFFIFSMISYIFYTQTDHLSYRIGEYSSRLINKASLMGITKSSSCKGCDNIKIYQPIPEKIGGIVYNVSFNQKQIQTIFYSKLINSTSYNFNQTFSFSGNMMSNNKKLEIQINNILKTIQVK